MNNTRSSSPLSVPVSAVIGANCRRIRCASGVTQNELAAYARPVGLRWTASKVGDFEAGRNAPTFGTVIAAMAALSAATGTAVTLPDLLQFDGHIAITDQLVPHGRVVADVARGQPLTLTSDDRFAALFAEVLRRTKSTSTIDVAGRSGVDEYRLARRMRISPKRLAELSFTLWGRPFSAERDRRAGADANRQKKGQVSRVLQAELREAMMSHGDD